MAINSKLIHFKNKHKFEEELANNNILDRSIVFILDSKEISTHGTVYKTVNWSVLEPKIVTFKVVHWNDDTSTEYTFIEGMTWEEFCNDPTFNTGEWTTNEYEVSTYYFDDGSPWGYLEYRWLVSSEDILYDKEDVNMYKTIIAGHTYYEKMESGGIGGGFE